MFCRLKTRDEMEGTQFFLIWNERGREGGKDDGNVGRSYIQERERERRQKKDIRHWPFKIIKKMYMFECMHEYERRGRDVDEDVGVPFIISMWLIEIRIWERERKRERESKKWKQWTWNFPIWILSLSFSFLGSIFVTNENNFYVSTSMRERGRRGFIVTNMKKGGCEWEKGDSWLAIKRVLRMYFGDYQMTFISTWPTFPSLAQYPIVLMMMTNALHVNNLHKEQPLSENESVNFSSLS
jgi:hypothetical protein